MSELFNALGWILGLIGAAWCLLVLSQATPRSSMEYFGLVVAVLPGLSIIGSGLIFLAIGGVLARLDKIVRSAADTADATEDLLAHVRGQGQ